MKRDSFWDECKADPVFVMVWAMMCILFFGGSLWAWHYIATH